MPLAQHGIERAQDLQHKQAEDNEGPGDDPPHAPGSPLTQQEGCPKRNLGGFH